MEGTVREREPVAQIPTEEPDSEGVDRLPPALAETRDNAVELGGEVAVFAVTAEDQREYFERTNMAFGD